MRKEIKAWLKKSFVTTSSTPESIDEIIDKALYRLKSGCSVLDVGPGTGENSIYMARRGFKVTAFYESEVDLKKIKERAAMEGLEIEIVQGNITNLNELSKLGKFPAITSINQLQRLSIKQIGTMISCVQSQTEIGGYNVIQTFETIEWEKSAPVYLFKRGALKEILQRAYFDWVKDYMDPREFLGRWEYDTEKEQKYRHHFIGLIAQKLSE